MTNGLVIDMMKSSVHSMSTGSSSTATDFSWESDHEDNNNKTIRFDSVTIVEIGMILGDNPGCSSGGPPVQLGSKVVSSVTRSIDDHEEVKAESTSSRRQGGSRRRRRGPTVIPPHQRSHMMLHARHSMKEICEATVAVQDYQKLRQESLEHYELNCTMRQRITTFLSNSGVRGILSNDKNFTIFFIDKIKTIQQEGRTKGYPKKHIS